MSVSKRARLPLPDDAPEDPGTQNSDREGSPDPGVSGGSMSDGMSMVDVANALMETR